MREIFTSGSVGGAPGNRCFYPELERGVTAVAKNQQTSNPRQVSLVVGHHFMVYKFQMELESKSIRLEALRSMRWTAFLLIFAFTAMLFIDANFKSVIHIIGRFIIIPMAILCLPFMINCIELISGRQFIIYDLAWENLKGWQRGILGSIIVVISFAIIFFIGFTVAMKLYGPNS